MQRRFRDERSELQVLMAEQRLQAERDAFERKLNTSAFVRRPSDRGRMICSR